EAAGDGIVWANGAGRQRQSTTSGKPTTAGTRPRNAESRVGASLAQQPGLPRSGLLFWWAINFLGRMVTKADPAGSRHATGGSSPLAPPGRGLLLYPLRLACRGEEAGADRRISLSD